MAVQDGFSDSGIINKLENTIKKNTVSSEGILSSSGTLPEFPLSDQWNTPRGGGYLRHEIGTGVPLGLLIPTL